MKRITLLRGGVLAAAVFAVAACGETAGERGLSGAGIGAGAGAVGGALMGAPATGAALGAGTGAAAGAFTDESQIDLGEPIWE